MDYKNIKLRRKELGMTQQQVADAADITTRALSSIERGASVPHDSTVQRLADTLFPGEPEKMRDLISPPPDYSERLEWLDTSTGIPGYIKPALYRLLDLNDAEGISYFLACTSSILPYIGVRDKGNNLLPYLPSYCRALLSSTALSAYLNELETFWQQITNDLLQLGDPAQNAYSKMEDTHRSADFGAKLSAVKSAVSTAQALFAPENVDRRAICLDIIRSASVILSGAKITVADRTALFEMSVDLFVSFFSRMDLPYISG